MKTVVIAENKKLQHSLLSEYLNHNPALHILAHASTSLELMEDIHTYHPDSVIIDARIPFQGTAQSVQVAKAMDRNINVILLMPATSMKSLETKSATVYGIGGVSDIPLAQEIVHAIAGDGVAGDDVTNDREVSEKMHDDVAEDNNAHQHKDIHIKDNQTKFMQIASDNATDNKTSSTYALSNRITEKIITHEMLTDNHNRDFENYISNYYISSDPIFEAALKSTDNCPQLSKRELEVAQQIAMGKHNKEVAQALTITVETVKTHVHHILEKINGENRQHIVSYMYENHLIEY